MGEPYQTSQTSPGDASISGGTHRLGVRDSSRDSSRGRDSGGGEDEGGEEGGGDFHGVAGSGEKATLGPGH